MRVQKPSAIVMLQGLIQAVDGLVLVVTLGSVSTGWIVKFIWWKLTQKDDEE